MMKQKKNLLEKTVTSRRNDWVATQQRVAVVVLAMILIIPILLIILSVISSCWTGETTSIPPQIGWDGPPPPDIFDTFSGRNLVEIMENNNINDNDCPTLQLPIAHLPAYSHYCRSMDTDSTSHGNCPSTPLGSPVDAILSTKSNNCLADCFVGHSIAGELLDFGPIQGQPQPKEEEGSAMQLKITLTLASARPKWVTIQILSMQNEIQQEETVTAPGKGWTTFESVQWTTTSIISPQESNDDEMYMIRIVFDEGATNLCTLSVEAVGGSSGPDVTTTNRPTMRPNEVMATNPLPLPFARNAVDGFSRSSFSDTTSHNEGDCHTNTPVDAKKLPNDHWKNVCMGECYISHTDDYEYVDFDFVVGFSDGGTVRFSIWLASQGRRQVQFQIIHNAQVHVQRSVDTPARGWTTFVEYEWTVDLPALSSSYSTLRLLFINGKTNVCAVQATVVGDETATAPPTRRPTLVPTRQEPRPTTMPPTHELKEEDVLQVPFHVNALAYTGYSDTTSHNEGNCDTESGPLDARTLPNNALKEKCLGPCHISNTEDGEYVEYAFDGGGKLDIYVLLASNSRRNVMLELDGGDDSKMVTSPGGDWNLFRELKWTMDDPIPNQRHVLRVIFLQGRTNLCSVRIESRGSAPPMAPTSLPPTAMPVTLPPTKSPSPTAGARLQVPFQANALEAYTGYRESNPANEGNCQRDDNSGVDGKVLSTNQLKETCLGRCHISHTRSDEYLDFAFASFPWQENEELEVVVLISSYGRKEFTLELVGEPFHSGSFTSPAQGWDAYRPYRWIIQDLPAGNHVLRITFVHGNTNVCALWIVPSTPAPTNAPVTPTPAPTPAPGTFPTYRIGHLTTNKVGLLLSQGLDAREIARTGQRVPYDTGGQSARSFHGEPDGGAVFSDTRSGNRNGWVYVSNSEMAEAGAGGVGAITFNAQGQVIDYRMVLTGTTKNCNGGPTPWNTWVSCEEKEGGKIYQVDPFGGRSPQQAPIGRAGGWWEAFAVDRRSRDRPVFFATEDFRRGPLRRYRLTQNANWNDRWNILNQAGRLDYLMLDKRSAGAGRVSWTTNLGAARANAERFYPHSEGADVHNGILTFVCKQIKQVFMVDLDQGTYTNRTTRSGLFDGSPDTIVRMTAAPDEYLYFTEEGGRDAGVHARDRQGRFYTVLESPVYIDETAGLAFSPDGRHLYIAYQHSGRLFDVWRLDGRPFHGQVMDVKAHAGNDGASP